jgi:hypothetical protein
MKHGALVCTHLLVGFVALSLLALPTQGQILKIGTWGNAFTPPGGCPGLPSNCQAVAISCPNALPLTATYAVTQPQGTPNGIFQYPSTYMQAWLCNSVSPPHEMNESTPLGWIFYQAVDNSGTQPLKFMMTAVEGCPTAEGFTGGTIGAGPYGGLGGMKAVEYDMSNPNQTQTAVCKLGQR